MQTMLMPEKKHQLASEGLQELPKGAAESKDTVNFVCG
jgi:hypothetical protein